MFFKVLIIYGSIVFQKSCIAMLFLYFQDPLAFYFMEIGITQAYLDLFQEMYY